MPKAKHIAVFLVFVIILLLLYIASSSIPLDEYEKIVTEKDAIQTQYDSAVSSASEALLQLQSEYSAYKGKMQPYEELAEEEAEVRKVEAEKILKQQKEKEEAMRKEEEKARAAEEAKGYETGITYNNIARYPDDYKGKKLKLKGKVLQVIETGSSVEIRLAVDNNYEHVIYGEYSKDITDSRILENDIITIYGISMGTVTYESTLGGPITIPFVGINKIN